MNEDKEISITRTIEDGTVMAYLIEAEGVDASVTIRHSLEADIEEDKFLSMIVDQRFANWMLNALTTQATPDTGDGEISTPAQPIEEEN